VPEWFDELRTRVAEDLADAQARADSDRQELDQLNRRRTAAEAERSTARRELHLHQSEMDAARASLERARSQRQAADGDLRQARSWNRRTARRRLEDADHALNDAHAQKAHIDAITAPARTACQNTASLIRELDDSIRTTRILQEWSGGPDHAQQLTDLASALDRWHSWAIGEPTEPVDLIESARTFTATSDPEYGRACQHLADQAITWAQHTGIDIARAIAPQPSPPVPSIGIQLEL
jgi:hypothetical protein